MRSHGTILALTVALLALVLGVGLGGLRAAPATPVAASPAASPAVVREVLGTGLPPAAPGQALQLVRFTIAPGTTLPVHTHPGMQVAWLASGTLRYTVVRGQVRITRAAVAGTPGAVETLRSGQTTTFHAGDSWVEPPGMVHFARNDGPAPVVIWVASLLATNQPPSIPVTIATPAA